jgi:hypothetical protein
MMPERWPMERFVAGQPAMFLSADVAAISGCFEFPCRVTGADDPHSAR